MPVYSHLAFYSDGGQSIVRDDENIGRVTLFLWRPDGEIEISEYDDVDANGFLSGFRRSVTYNTGTDDYSMTWIPGQYDIENSPFLGDGNDNETYGNENDHIRANGGNDIIDAGNGHNIIRGHTGNDTLTGGNQTDIIFGNEGTDSLFGGAKNDYLFGGADIDNLRGNGGNDVMSGGLVNDRIHGSIGHDIVYDIHGSNTIHSGDGEDYVITGDGEDYIRGGADRDVIVAGSGADRVYGSDGDDHLVGEDGADRLYGENGNDVIFGMLESDRIEGGDDNDVLNGGGGGDYLFGGEGDDRVEADSPNETGGYDWLYGGAGDDRMQGGDLMDKIFGESGDDLLIATSDGQAQMNGGSDSDTFAFMGIHSATHRILDLQDEDFINMSDLLSGFDPLSDAIDDFVRLIYRNDNRTDIKINADGEGGGWLAAAVVHTNWSGATASDLVSEGQIILDHKLFTSDS